MVTSKKWPQVKDGHSKEWPVAMFQSRESRVEDIHTYLSQGKLLFKGGQVISSQLWHFKYYSKW